MAMTITEASATQDLLGHLAAEVSRMPESTKKAKVIEAGNYLAERSYKVLSAGMDGRRWLEATQPPDLEAQLENVDRIQRAFTETFGVPK